MLKGRKKERKKKCSKKKMHAELIHYYKSIVEFESGETLDNKLQ